MQAEVWQRLERLHGDSPADPTLAAALAAQRQRRLVQQGGSSGGGGSSDGGHNAGWEQQSEGTAISLSSGSAP